MDKSIAPNKNKTHNKKENILIASLLRHKHLILRLVSAANVITIVNGCITKSL